MGAEEGYFGERVAAAYDAHSGSIFDPAVVAPAVDRLADLARRRPVAGVRHRDRPHRAPAGRARRAGRRHRQLRGDARPAAREARRRADRDRRRRHGDHPRGGEFALVYLVFNTIFNLTTQDGQVACFENAASHLRSGGRFVIEARVPELQRLPLGQTVLPWRADPGGLSYYVYDVITQRLSGQHYHLEDGRIEAGPTEMRYVWPAELDLMARLAGMRLEQRSAGWGGEPFTALSPSHVSVYVKP